MKLSVIIITKNEEKSLAQCLQSCQGIADEIVIVDSFSTDGTQAIAKSFGCRLFQHAFEGYGQQRNYAAQLSAYDHVLFLDADEVISPRLKASLLELKKKGIPSGSVYQLKRLNFIGTKPLRFGGFYPNKQTRLYNRRETSWTEPKVHETLIIPPNFSVHILKGDLLHYSFLNLSHFKGTQVKYIKLKSKDKNKIKPHGYLYLKFRIAFKFIRSFFIFGGFLMGKFGFKIAVTQAQVEQKFQLENKKNG